MMAARNSAWRRNPKMTAIMPEVAGLGIAPSHGVRFHMFLNAYSRTVGKGKDKVKVDRALLEAQMRDETWATGYFNDPWTQPLPETVQSKFPAARDAVGAAAARLAMVALQQSRCRPAASNSSRARSARRSITFVTTTKLNPLFGPDSGSRMR